MSDNLIKGAGEAVFRRFVRPAGNRVYMIRVAGMIERVIEELDIECKTTRDQLLKAQQNEIDECHIYRKLAEVIGDNSNRELLEGIGSEEFEHYQLLKRITRQELRPRKMRVLLYRTVARVLGLSVE